MEVCVESFNFGVQFDGAGKESKEGGRVRVAEAQVRAGGGKRRRSNAAASPGGRVLVRGKTARRKLI